MADLVAAIDQGTTSSRCMLFDANGSVVAQSSREHRQSFPRPGWVEHDAEEIWRNVEFVVREALGACGGDPSRVAAVGVTNQRETTLVWDRASGRPVHPAIVWQDVRTDEAVRRLAGREGPDRFRSRCGLPLATYFSAPKIGWILDHVPGARAAAEAGRLAFGTMESWLVWKLTGRHVTDVTNASRTMLMNLKDLAWDGELLEAFGVPAAMLPEIRPSSEVFATAGGPLPGVPVAGALGDQQAALFGQTCFEPGEAKCTYGTGAFLVMNTGAELVQSRHGLLTTLAYQVSGEAPCYALEGSIAVAGALVQWLRDNLKMIGAASEIEALAASVPDSGGCCFVPAFSGLFAPYWRSDARGVVAGLTGYVTRAHIARAALEATAWQVRDVCEAMEKDRGPAKGPLRVDGGMTANALLLQIQADALDREVVRPEVVETTCLGAAYAAGLAVGFWRTPEELRARTRTGALFSPRLDAARREADRARWTKAVRASLDWVDQGQETL